MEGAPSRSKVSPSVLRWGPPATPTPTRPPPRASSPTAEAVRLNTLEDRLSLEPRRRPPGSSGLEAAAAVAGVPPGGLLSNLGGLSGNMTTPSAAQARTRITSADPPGADEDNLT